MPKKQQNQMKKAEERQNTYEMRHHCFIYLMLMRIIEIEFLCRRNFLCAVVNFFQNYVLKQQKNSDLHRQKLILDLVESKLLAKTKL